MPGQEAEFLWCQLPTALSIWGRNMWDCPRSGRIVQLLKLSEPLYLPKMGPLASKWQRRLDPNPTHSRHLRTTGGLLRLFFLDFNPLQLPPPPPPPPSFPFPACSWTGHPSKLEIYICRRPIFVPI